MAKYCIAAYRIIALIICLEIKYFFLKSKNWVARSAHACVQFVFLPSRFIPLDFIAFESPANFPFSMHLAAAFLLPTLPKNPPPFHHLYSAVLFFSYRINHLFEKPTAIQIVERFPKTLCHRRPWNWSVRADRETWVGDQYGGQASDSATFRGVLCYRQEHARVFWWYFSFYYEEYVFYCEGKSKMIQGNVIFVYVR